MDLSPVLMYLLSVAFVAAIHFLCVIPFYVFNYDLEFNRNIRSVIS